MRDTNGQMSLEAFALRQVEVRVRLAEAPAIYSADPVNSPDAAVSAMAAFLGEMDREYCCVVNLDAQHHPINFNVVSIGDIDMAIVPIQNIFKTAILSNAASFILLHNHPSGSCTPSLEDVALTRRVIEAGELMHIPCLDHIIVGDAGKKTYSFKKETTLFLADPGMIPVRETGPSYDASPDFLAVLRIAPDKEPEMIAVQDTLRDMQAAVGGPIEVVYPFEEPVCIICNEEGKLLGLPPNRALKDKDGEVMDILAGDFLIAGLSAEGFSSLTGEQMSRYGDMFKHPEMFVRQGGKVRALPRKPSVLARIEGMEKQQKAAKDTGNIKQEVMIT